MVERLVEAHTRMQVIELLVYSKNMQVLDFLKLTDMHFTSLNTSVYKKIEIQTVANIEKLVNAQDHITT